MESLRILARRHVTAIWRHRWLAVACAWLICGVGWVGVFVIPDKYEASARLYVDADAVLTPLLRGLAVENTLAGQLDVLQRTLLSRPNLEKLVSSTDLDLSVSGPAELERLVARLGNEIRITPQTHNLFTIVYRNSSPKLAYDVVQVILNTFFESKAGKNRAEMENAHLFLQQQIDSYEKQLREAEKKRADFRAKYVDLLPSDGAGGATRLEAARTSVRSLQGQLQDAQAKRETLIKELTTTPTLLVTETEAIGGHGNTRLHDAERTLTELRSRYTEQHPDVVAQRQLVAALKAPGHAAADPLPRAVPRNRSLPNPVYEQLKVRVVENDSIIASLRRQVTDASKERDELETAARGAPGLQAEYTNINRDYDVLRKNYEELLARRESMRIATAAEADGDKIKMQVVDPPQLPRNPVAPRRVLLLSGVLAAGLAGGIGLALLLAQFDHSFHTIDEMRALGLPVLGGVSLLVGVTSLRERLAPVAAFGAAVLSLCAVYGGLLWGLLGIASAA